jgi:hypothetical protein
VDKVGRGSSIRTDRTFSRNQTPPFIMTKDDTAGPNRGDDLLFLVEIRELLVNAPMREPSTFSVSAEVSDRWFLDARDYWKEVFAILNRNQARLQELMKEFLRDEDFPPVRSYRWQESGEFVPDQKLRVIRDLPAMLGNIRYNVPGVRARKLALIMVEKMSDRLEMACPGDSVGDRVGDREIV